jgi:hypothetical protein
MKGIAKAKKSVITQIKSGIKFTKLGHKYYTNANSLYGDKVSDGNRLAINQLLEEGIVEFVGNTLRIVNR